MRNDQTDWKANATKKRIKQLLITTWVQIIELYPETPYAVHTVNLMRSRGNVVGKNKDGTPKYRDPYFLKDEDMLKIMESYREELDLMTLESVQNTEEYE